MADRLSIIKKYLNAKGKVNCLDAFKLAKELKVEPMEIGALTKAFGIRIDNCELGVFGDLEFKEKNESIYNELLVLSDDEKKINCKDAWHVAKDSSLKKVGSTTKNSDLEVVYCKLGCFRRREHDGRKE